MPLIPDTPSDNNQYVSNEEANRKPVAPTFGESFNAAFRMENDVVNAVSLIAKPAFAADPQYLASEDLRERDRMNKTTFYDDYFNNFTGSQSTAETTYIMQKIQQEQRDRQVSADSGFGGFVLDAAAGLLSPLTAIPLVGPMTRAKGAWQFAKEAAALGAVGGTLQEGVLQAGQETRPWSESAIGIAGQTLLSGVLGGAIGHLTKAEVAAASKSLTNSHVVVSVPEAQTIPARPRLPGAVIKESGSEFDGEAVFMPGIDRPVVGFVRTKNAAGEDGAYIGISMLPKEEQGKGIALEAYKTLIDDVFERGGTFVNSDMQVSASAARVYERLAKDGYTVEKAPDFAKHAEEKGVVVGGYADGTGAFRVTGVPERITGTPGSVAVSGGMGSASSVGAAATAGPTATELASGGKTIAKALDKTPLLRNPVTYNIQQPGLKHVTTEVDAGVARKVEVEYTRSDVARGNMAQISDAGLRYADNDRGVPTAGGLGGTVENLIQTHYDAYPAVIKELDDGFRNYRFDNVAPPRGANARIMLQDVMKNTGGKLTGSEYKTAISQALRNGDVHEIPQVAATAANIREKLFMPLLTEAQRLGIIGKDIDLKGDVSWLMRDYDRNVIRSNTTEFVDQIAAHFEKGLQEDFAKELGAMKLRDTRADELVHDLTRSPDQTKIMQEQFLEKRKKLEEGANSEHLTALEDTVSNLRGQARDLRKSGNFDDRATARQMMQDAKALEEGAGQPLKDLKSGRSEINRRLSNLNKSKVVLEAKQARALETIEKIEDVSMNSLRAVARAGQDVLNRMDRWSDAELDKQLAALKTKFAQLGEVFDRGEERMGKMVQNEPDISKLIDLEDIQTNRANRMTDVANRVADAEDLGRDALRELIEDALDQVMQRTQKLNAKRAVRAADLAERAKNLDPAQVAQRITDIRAKGLDRRTSFLDDWRVRGADAIDLDKGTAVFKDYAREQANAAKDRVMGTNVRLAQVGKDPGLRGSEIERTLNIPSNLIEKFLNNDVESLMRSTLRTFAPDIEMARRFGDVNGEEKIFNKLTEEMNIRLEEVGHNEKLTPAQKQKMEAEINETFGKYRQNFEGVIGRLRHTRGLPDDPDGMSYKLGRFVLNLNTMRYMGGVTISSLPDVGRPIMRYGLLRTFNDAFIPLITNFKETKMNMSLVRQLMGGLDPAMQSRSRALTDLLEESNRGSKFEKAMEYGTSKVGQIALFEYWTSAMKQLSGLVANRKFMDSLEAIHANGKNIDLKEGTRFLAENDIGGSLAAKIWDDLTKEGGGNLVDGKWWPNTQTWAPETKRAYSAAMIREGNITIVTPGVERPLWTDRDMFMRMLAQFKSFGFSSTSKVVISGMQQRDAAIVNGVAVSLAMGALSYYTYARTVGGKTEQEMLNAKPGKWADEAINRSGILAIFGNIQDISGRIPAVAPYSSFSGGRTTKSSGGDDLLDVLGGPSYSAASSAAKVVTGLVSRDSNKDLQAPSQGSVHQLRTLLPYQNLIGFRRLLDMLEGQAPVRPR